MMSLILMGAGCVQIAFGVLIVAAARGAIHETTAAVAIGMGFLALGLGRLLHYREVEETRRAPIARQAVQNEDAGELSALYKGHDIRRVGMFVKVDGQMFTDLAAAKQHIDGLAPR